LGRPLSVQSYVGEFGHETSKIEDIIALHLAAGQNDIILMLGFDFQKISTEISDRYELHKIKNYYGLTRSLISSRTDIQWVLVDHSDNLDKSFKELTNFTIDTLKNVLKLLTDA
jgi:hypothetical protein